MIIDYFKPSDVAKALKLKKKDVFYMAGGTEINSVLKPSKIIDLSDLNLDKIKVEGSKLIIGSCVVLQKIIDSAKTPDILKKVCLNVVNRNIRNAATIGGNIASNKSCSNLIPLLIVLEAELELGNGKIISVEKYISKKKDDLIISIILDLNLINSSYSDVAVYRRTANDISILSIALSFKKTSEKISEMKIAVGGLDQNVIRLKKLEKVLEEHGKISDDVILKKVISDSKSIDDMRGSAEFKNYETAMLISDCLIKGGLN